MDRRCRRRRRRRPLRIWVVRYVGCTGHGAIVIVVWNLRIVARGVWVHVAALIHAVVDLLLMVILLLVVMVV